MSAAAEATLLGKLESAGAAMRVGDLAAATRAIDEALAIAPQDPRARTQLGLLFFQQGRFAEAAATFEGVVAAQPSSARARMQLGLAQLKRGAYAEAALDLERSLVLDPTDTRARSYLGLAYARVGDRQRAREAFRAAGREDLARAVTEAGEPGARGPGLVEFAAARALPEGGAALRLAGEGALVASTAEGIRIRRGGWIAMRGDVSAAAAELPGRHQGEVARTGAPIVLAEGPGEIVVAPRGGRFELMALESEVVYLAARALFAWTAPLRAECGRVPGRSPLYAMRLAGRGQAAVRTTTPLVTARLLFGQHPCVDAAALVGWTGGVRVHMSDDTALAVRLEGEGAALLET